LDHVLTDWEKNSHVKGIILTGKGKAFVAGADITQFNSLNNEGAKTFAKRGQEVFGKCEKILKPVLAAVNGFALGGGCELILACDFIYASENAKFGQPEVNLGIMCGWGGTQRMPRFVGLPRARELLFSGEMISAEEAFRIGLVNKLCKPEELMNESVKKMKLILSRGPLAVAQTKKVLNETFLTAEEGLKKERDAFSYLFSTSDKKEGVNAFLEKRPANFQGK
ncbi:MAG TPA: enoyl-CoA hydratase-related protein, partial [Bdellovibrionota bacterium]|nr:enoyl-CoA hydratase-related protein [Bdellovibrionota bacterium]